jgi:CheY-like chemotaxis protein
LLESAGYHVTRVTSAPLAVERVRADPSAVDLVITDYNMPVMSGIALAEALCVVAPGLPVVITSGYVTEELRDRARRAGVSAVLFKENSFEQLGGIVQGILARAAADRKSAP